MSLFNNGFDKAQRDYDRQLPPGSDDDDETCPDCEGSGEYPEGCVCEKCDSAGVISKKAAYVAWLEGRADMLMDLAKDEPRKIGSDIDRYLDKHPED